MTLEPLLSASFAIRLHVATVVPAALIGAWLLWARKGTTAHRLLGRLWMGLMVLTALSTFFIHEIRLVGDFSPIHLLSVTVLVSAFQAVRAARAGNIAAHAKAVKVMYGGGIVAAGLFTFLPGRIMNAIVFSAGDGPADPAALARFAGLVLAAFLAMMVLAWFSARRRTAG